MLSSQLTRKLLSTPFTNALVRSTFATSTGAGFSFRLTDEQKALKDLARKFAREEIAPKAAHYDRTGEFPWDLLKKAHELGLLSVSIPEGNFIIHLEQSSLLPDDKRGTRTGGHSKINRFFILFIQNMAALD